MEVPRMTRLRSSRPEPCSGAPVHYVFPSRPSDFGCAWPRCASPLAGMAAARQLLREIDDVPSHRPALGILVDQVEEFRRVPTSGRCGGHLLHPMMGVVKPCPRW